VDGKLERVRPQDITTTALLSVEGELDDISGSGQTEAVHDICTGVPKTHQRHFEPPVPATTAFFPGGLARTWQVKALRHFF
jgi:poly(3-hydroxybutyrate) depolymerase